MVSHKVLAKKHFAFRASSILQVYGFEKHATSSLSKIGGLLTSSLMKRFTLPAWQHIAFVFDRAFSAHEHICQKHQVDTQANFSYVTYEKMACWYCNINKVFLYDPQCFLSCLVNCHCLSVKHTHWSNPFHFCPTIFQLTSLKLDPNLRLRSIFIFRVLPREYQKNI